MTAGEAFPAYGVAHWMILAVTVLGALVLVWIGRRQRGSAASEVFCRVWGVVQVAVTLAFLLVWLLPGWFDLGQSLPLHLSDLLRFVSAYALLRRRPWAVAATYYWGLTLNTQALLTPDLHVDIAPALEIASYWVQHVLVLWIAVYLTWGLGLRPDWRRFASTVAITLGWASTVLAVNVLLGTNYGYLNGKPSGRSLLDHLGPWPWYLLVELALVSVVWMLMTLPWTLARRSQVRRNTITAR